MNAKAAPRPLTFEIRGKEKHTTFDTEELRNYLAATDEAAFIVEDDSGTQSIILVEPLRAILAQLVVAGKSVQ